MLFTDDNTKIVHIFIERYVPPGDLSSGNMTMAEIKTEAIRAFGSFEPVALRLFCHAGR